MVDLVVVNPNGREAAYQGLGAELAAVEPPLWCRLIAGYCRDRGWSVAIVDAEAEGLSYLDVTSRVNALDPRLVAVVAAGHQPSASTQTMPAAGVLCDSLAQFGGGPSILIGGHVSALPERTMREERCTFACVGEGPVTVDALLKLLRDDRQHWAMVPGLVWRDGLTIKVNQRAPLLDVASLHGDVWDLLPMGRYRAHNWHAGDGERQPYASVYTSLGCPYTCSFCCINAPFGVNRYRMRSPEHVVDEICTLYEKYGVLNFKITDEMFVLNRKHVRTICEGLIDEHARPELLNIWAYARIDTVKADDLALMRRAGITWLALGIEAADGAVRDGADKSFDDAAIRDVVGTIRAAGIKVIGNFIFGLPHDTFETMERTRQLALSLDLDFANFYSAMAYPGSRLFNEANPRDLPTSWSGYAQHSYDCTPLPTATLSSAAVLMFRDAAHEHYFRERQPEVATRLSRKLKGPLILGGQPSHSP